MPHQQQLPADLYYVGNCQERIGDPSDATRLSQASPCIIHCTLSFILLSYRHFSPEGRLLTTSGPLLDSQKCYDPGQLATTRDGRSVPVPTHTRPTPNIILGNY